MSISLPYHLLFPWLAALLVSLFGLWKRRRVQPELRWKLFWNSVVVFGGVYMLIVGIAIYYDLYYQWDLNRYDLDHDGYFGGDEITRDQEEAMNRLTNDVGRNLTPIAGLLYSGILAIVYLIASRIMSDQRTQGN